MTVVQYITYHIFRRQQCSPNVFYFDFNLLTLVFYVVDCKIAIQEQCEHHIWTVLLHFVVSKAANSFLFLSSWLQVATEYIMISFAKGPSFRSGWIQSL